MTHPNWRCSKNLPHICRTLVSRVQYSSISMMRKRFLFKPIHFSSLIAHKSRQNDCCLPINLIRKNIFSLWLNSHPSWDIISKDFLKRKIRVVEAMKNHLYSQEIITCKINLRILGKVEKKKINWKYLASVTVNRRNNHWWILILSLSKVLKWIKIISYSHSLSNC